MRFTIIVLIMLTLLCTGVSARDVQQGDTIYVNEPDLNMATAIPDNTLEICIWDVVTDTWKNQSCVNVRKNTINQLANWDDAPEHKWKFIPGDYYAVTEYIFEYRGIRDGKPYYVKYLPTTLTDSRSNYTFVFSVRPESEMPIPTEVPTPTPTPNYDEKIAVLETMIEDQKDQIKQLEEKTPVPTTIITTEPTPGPTATVNYTATIEALEKQMDEQNAKIKEHESILDIILKFLGLKKE